ncbi:MAG: hypothetical protein BRC53_12135 [Cyanobacteria bacterium SW_6_48_11]|nr:MAG: hypothetical protein BRC36_03665 [Cyanobacteria bacterium QH_2_48_84]PSO77701.1 MAG: hypothetical protein BRC37_01810 [Cyanobacteria bacterium QH_3_48_40]PSO94677.1 MAG: hypothetical protein BRC53_12135 [Cyanobacteria bacterium SW_6_48_11]PSP34733.1 MAG: hypothetical protein BRC57_11230 [Cyanobacteria bacterium QS_8_48_54]
MLSPSSTDGIRLVLLMRTLVVLPGLNDSHFMISPTWGENKRAFRMGTGVSSLPEQVCVQSLFTQMANSISANKNEKKAKKNRQLCNFCHCKAPFLSIALVLFLFTVPEAGIPFVSHGNPID